MTTIPYVKDEADFDERINGSVPVLVNFTASWCGPCKALAPVLDDMAGEYDAETLSIVKVDVDELPGLAEKFDVLGVPQLFLMEEGEVLAKFGGASKSELRKRIDEIL